jgi:hypothetical protein
MNECCLTVRGFGRAPRRPRPSPQTGVQARLEAREKRGVRAVTMVSVVPVVPGGRGLGTAGDSLEAEEGVEGGNRRDDRRLEEVRIGS